MYPEEYVPAAQDMKRMNGAKFVLEDEQQWNDRIWLLTVQHTGTHFAFKHLENLGYNQLHIHWDGPRIKVHAGPVHFIHSHIGIGAEWWRMKDNPVILTLRNPLEVFKSHLIRYRWPASVFVPYILQAFKDWRLLAGTFDSYVFQVDAEDQKDEVERMGDYLGAQSWTYKEQSVTTRSNRTPEAVERMIGEGQERDTLYANPPKEILDLATEFGY